jgi:molybdenum cofactor cytidylyltransferase
VELAGDAGHPRNARKSGRNRAAISGGRPKSMTIVILAAGAASRMGRQKLLLPIDGCPMIERVLNAAVAWPVVVVAGDEVAPALGPTALRIVRNAAPERGMAHSLRLANQVVPPDEPIAVLLADLPDISAQTIAAVIAAYDDAVDVVSPQHAGICTHPVIFGPLARRKIADLPDGDTIKRLRDDPSLRRRIIETSAEALTDIDTPSDYSARIAST